MRHAPDDLNDVRGLFAIAGGCEVITRHEPLKTYRAKKQRDKDNAERVEICGSNAGIHASQVLSGSFARKCTRMCARIYGCDDADQNWRLDSIGAPRFSVCVCMQVWLDTIIVAGNCFCRKMWDT
jgi:hypothetical protein